MADGGHETRIGDIYQRPAVGKIDQADPAVIRGFISGIPERIQLSDTGRRIEISRIRLADGSAGLYWRWRWQENGRRRSAYGGRVDTLPGPGRLRQYKRNRKRYLRRIGEKTQ